MTTKSKFQAIKGTRDLLPPETALWNRVEQTAHEVFATFGFGEIRLPIFEPTELFARSIGLETDVVSKEMYSFLDREAKFPDLTDLGNLKEFVEAVERAYRTGEIPASEWNRGMIERVKLEIEGFRKAEAQFFSVADPSMETLERHAHHIFGAAHWAHLIKLGDDISLRPEATASVCRAYIEHNLQQLPQPAKLYYMGPMFRRERPQKGRYRQFYQIGAEVLGGSDAPAIDAEVIDMLMTFFDKIGLQGATLYINSIGHSADNCRRAYVELLRTELQKVKDKLGADSQRRIDTNPLRVLDSKLEHEQPIIEKLPRIADHLCPDCAANYAAVRRELELRGIIYKENWRLVRGLDYYSRTTFEITAQGLGSQNAVCGGGRYDGLVELLGGPPTKATGFAIGEDRLLLSLQESAKASEASPNSPLVYPEREGRATRHSFTLSEREGPLVFIAWMGQHAYAAAIRAAKDLRNAGFSVELPPTELKFGKALGQADKLGAKYALILGDNEVAEGLWTLKTLTDGTQTKLPEPALIDHLRKSLERRVSS